MARWLAVLAALAMCRAQSVQRPRCHDPQRCAPATSGQDEYPYIVDGLKLFIEYTDSGYFVLKCSKNLTLDNSALPRFDTQLRVNKVQLQNCPAPQGTYAGVLDKLNVLVLDKLKLMSVGHLTREHLAGLADVRALELVQAELAPRALAALPGLRRLLLDRVRLPPGELLQLPAGLQALYLMRTGADLPPAVLRRLPQLVNVTVRDTRNVSVALGDALQVLAMDVPGARVPSALPGALRSLTVFGWDERRPARWSRCGLHELNLRDATAEALPPRWLGDCARLRVLRVEDAARLRELHATSLRGASLLRELHVTSCALTSLPAGLLDDAAELSVLDLSRNHLKQLPNGLFVRAIKSLQVLNLSRNRLTTDVFMSLSALTSLTTLRLSFNDLKDSCGGGSDIVPGTSPLQYLKKLTHLYLRRTGASRICRDWRDNMSLETLDLVGNNFTSITYADLQFRGAADVDVNLTRNNVSALMYSRHDYSLVTSPGAPRSRAHVELDGALACDCGAYWAARALRERPEHVRVDAKCAGGAALRDAPLDELVCGAPALCGAAPAACACAWRDSGAERPARVLRVRCERAGLARAQDALRPLWAAVRRAGAEPDDYDWQLLFAHNRIANLSVDDIPKHLSVLDLTNNSLNALSVETARALVADERRQVFLAHNPLACDCGAAAALAALRGRPAALRDLRAATCAGGGALRSASLAPCAAPPAPAAGVVAAAAALALLAGAAALGAALCHPALRRRLKAALHRRGWLPAAPEPDAGAYRYDVFLSFSHGDERVVRQLVARLEAGPAPYRVCVHYRDWAPGGWIPAQIAASVRLARRTVAVVSAHFLRSAWARAEFREAHALALRSARPRLVVVLLDAPAALPLDDRLRAYLAANTYVQWGDPWFWQKLFDALPRADPEPAPAAVETQASQPMETQEAQVSRPIEAQVLRPIEAQVSEPIEKQVLGPTEVQISGPIEVQVSGPIEKQVLGPTEVQISGPIEVQVSEPIEKQVLGPTEVQISGPIEVQVSGPIETQVSGPVEAQISEPIEAQVSRSPAGSEAASSVDGPASSSCSSSSSSTRYSSSSADGEVELDVLAKTSYVPNVTTFTTTVRV